MRALTAGGCAALIVCGQPAAQTVYRCTGADGKVTYQQAPCAAGVQQSQRSAAPSTGGFAAPARQTAVEQAQPAQAQPAAQAAQAPAPPKPRVDFDFAAQQGRVEPGMNRDQVRRAWGEPTRTETKMLDVGLQERWLWRDNSSRRREVMFTNGAVVMVDDHNVP